MPNFVRTKYQQYKRDTLQLSTWLAKAALHYGFPLTSFTESFSPLDDDADQQTAQQLRNSKKRAKKRAKAKGEPLLDVDVNGDTQSDSSMDVGDGDYLLTIPQFPEIARFLVEKEVNVPVELMQLIKRCISLRKRCLEKFLPDADSSTDRHLHFVDVLVKVANIFEDHNYPTATEATAATEVTSIKNLTNRFNVLEVEEGNENDADENLPDVNLPEPPKPAHGAVRTGRMTFGPVLSRDDGICSILTFFADVHTVRVYLKEVWGSYKVGKIDLISAAVTSNTAMELLRPPHEDIVRNVMPLFNDDIGFVMVILLNLVTRRHEMGIPILQIPLYSDIDDDDWTVHAAYEYLLIPNFQILGGFDNVIKDDSIPMYKAGYYGTYDPGFGQKSLSFRERWLQSQLLICETFAEYFMLVVVGEELLASEGKAGGEKEKVNLFFVDEMAVEVDRYAKTKECNLLLMVYSQIFIDINVVLGTDVTNGVEALRRSLWEMKCALDMRSTVEPKNKYPGWPEGLEKALEMLAEEIEFYRTQNILDLAKLGSRDMKAVKEAGKPSLLERDPIICGLILFRLRLAYQELGFTLANTWQSILSTAHLYVACRHFQNVPSFGAIRSWPDMDLIIDMHGKEDLFGGKIPLDIDDSYVSLLHMMGYSRETLGAVRLAGTGQDVPDWLDNNRQQIGKSSPEGAQGLKDHAPILGIFKERYLGNLRSGVALDIQTIDSILSSVRHSTIRGASKLRREKKHRSPKYSVMQLLSVLEVGLRFETNSIRFDYISMHLRCLRILKAVQVASRDYLAQKHGDMYREDHSDATTAVAMVLHVAVLSARSARNIGIKVPVGSKLLLGANNAMKKCLADSKEAREETDKLRG